MRAVEEGDAGTEEGGWGDEKAPEEADTDWLCSEAYFHSAAGEE